MIMITKHNINLEKNPLTNFGMRVLNMLVENSNQTYIAGGTVRDILLKRKLRDFDIATDLQPETVWNLLEQNFSAKRYRSEKHLHFGVSKIQLKNSAEIDITTFRKEVYKEQMYPKVVFVESAKQDSKRRDFTINSLYLSNNLTDILDFHKGVADLKNKVIRFIGNPKKRIREDPLRIIRALRLALILDFKLEKNTAKAIQKHFDEIKNITSSKTFSEINKLKNIKKKNFLKHLITDRKSLDNYLEKFYY